MSWMPGIDHDPGELANYEEGHNRKQAVKLHYTAGVNSAPIGRRGFFQFLVPRAGIPTQFAPSDAINWDSGNWNDAGPGIEFEYREQNDGPAPENIVTDSQIEWGGKIIRWLSVNDGYPLTFYDGVRIQESAGFRGFITHRSLVQSEEHSDYITKAQFDLMIGASPPITEEDPMPWSFLTADDTTGDLFVLGPFSGAFYCNSGQLYTDLQNQALTFGQKNVATRKTPRSVLNSLPRANEWPKR